MSKLLSSQAASALLGSLSPEWSHIPVETDRLHTGAGPFLPRFKPIMLSPEMLANSGTAIPEYIRSQRPGLLVSETTGAKSDRLKKALQSMSNDIQLIGEKAKGKMHGFPNIMLPPVLEKSKSEYSALRRFGESDLHPANIANVYGQHSVYGKHPLLTSVIGNTAKKVNKNLAWMIPSAMFAGKFATDAIPGEIDDKALAMITKYGPETFLASSLAANALPALAATRAASFMPKNRLNTKMMKRDLLLNALKIGGGYGAMALARKFLNKESAVSGDNGRLLELARKLTYKHAPGMAAAALLGTLMHKVYGKAKISEQSAIGQTTSALPTVSDMIQQQELYGTLRLGGEPEWTSDK